MAHPHFCVLHLPFCGIGSLAGLIVKTFFTGLATLVGSAAAWLLGLVGSILGSSTTPPVTSAWFLAKERLIFEVAAPIGLIAIVAGALRAIVTGSIGELGRMVLVRLPVAVLLGAAGAGLVGLAVSATDQVSATLATGSGGSLASTLHVLATAAVATGGTPAAVVVVASGLVALGALLLWVELLVRAAAITVATALLPLVFAASLWPPGVAWARRLVETLAALIVSKAVIVLVLSIAVDAIAHAGAGPSTVLTGGALLLLASMMPYALLRLVPAVEAAAVSHLESVGHRATAPVRQAPRQAVAMALGNVGIAAAPSIDLVGSDPIGMMPGIDEAIDPFKGTALDPDAKFVKKRPPIKDVPASSGTHHWERDENGPKLVWRPGRDGAA
ncbi:MAG TPA: hypothetical protein VIE15_07135 [Acidimicrobiales bacterium]|jgi:hypothetical protein